VAKAKKKVKDLNPKGKAKGVKGGSFTNEKAPDPTLGTPRTVTGAPARLLRGHPR